jgi:hypothetical protein
VDLVRLLLEQGAPLDARDLAGSTALYTAADNDRLAVVQQLLVKGADPNLPGRSGVTPIAAAAFRDNDQAVALLLGRGADPKVADATGKTPIMYAAAPRPPTNSRRPMREGIGIARIFFQAAIDNPEAINCAHGTPTRGPEISLTIRTSLASAGTPAMSNPALRASLRIGALERNTSPTTVGTPRLRARHSTYCSNSVPTPRPRQPSATETATSQFRRSGATAQRASPIIVRAPASLISATKVTRAVAGGTRAHHP